MDFLFKYTTETNIHGGRKTKNKTKQTPVKLVEINQTLEFHLPISCDSFSSFLLVSFHKVLSCHQVHL